MSAIGLVLWVVDSGELFNLVLWVVGDNHLNRIEHSADTDSTAVQIVANSTLQESHVVKGINLGVANLIDELDDTLWAVTTATESADSWHTGVVPTAYHVILYQCQQITL